VPSFGERQAKTVHFPQPTRASGAAKAPFLAGCLCLFDQLLMRFGRQNSKNVRAHLPENKQFRPVSRIFGPCPKAVVPRATATGQG